MKKTFAIFMALALVLASIPALAESAPDAVGYSGTATYRSEMTLLAPFGGTLADYNLRVGDTLKAGETLFSIGTAKIYSPVDGTVRGLQAMAGDDTASVIDRYGSLLSIEPAGCYTPERQHKPRLQQQRFQQREPLPERGRNRVPA